MNSVASSSSSSPPEFDSDIKSLLSSTRNVLQQSPPPSLREILGAYRTKGDGDRDMLIAMLNAKSAEDQRMASIAALHRQVLEIYRASSPPPQLPQINLPHYQPAPFFSPPHPKDTHPSKRRRSSSSSHELPPSPRSDSAEYSPRSRASMAIGSLLTRRDDDDEHPRSPSSSS